MKLKKLFSSCSISYLFIISLSNSISKYKNLFGERTNNYKRNNSTNSIINFSNNTYTIIANPKSIKENDKVEKDEKRKVINTDTDEYKLKPKYNKNNKNGKKFISSNLLQNKLIINKYEIEQDENNFLSFKPKEKNKQIEEIFN